MTSFIGRNENYSQSPAPNIEAGEVCNRKYQVGDTWQQVCWRREGSDLPGRAAKNSETRAHFFGRKIFNASRRFCASHFLTLPRRKGKLMSLRLVFFLSDVSYMVTREYRSITKASDSLQVLTVPLPAQSRVQPAFTSCPFEHCESRLASKFGLTDGRQSPGAFFRISQGSLMNSILAPPSRS